MVSAKQYQEYNKFLWLPKKIGNKWHWLTNIKVREHYEEMVVGADIVKVKSSVEYELNKGGK